MSDEYLETYRQEAAMYKVHYESALVYIRELEAALRKYGYHDVTCDFLRDTLSCTCGFESLRAALARKKPPAHAPSCALFWPIDRLRFCDCGADLAPKEPTALDREVEPTKEDF